MIREVHGDILASTAEALVNPVNTVGVMGAGLAAQFKRAYPVMFAAYQADCRSGEVRTGRMHVHLLDGGPWRKPPYLIVNFPTKRDWRKPSTPAWVDAGLADLRRVIELMNIRSVAIPPLGCGLGGLQWPDVRELIYMRLGDLNGVDVMLYAPEGQGPVNTTSRGIFR